VTSLISFGPANPVTFRWGNETVESVRAGIGYRF
jgi:hypothetical protein